MERKYLLPWQSIFIYVLIFIFSFTALAPAQEGEDKNSTGKKPEEFLQYESLDNRDFDLSVGLRYEKKENGTVDIDVASTATGKGAALRKWEVVDTSLIIGKEPVRPKSYIKIYTVKASRFVLPAEIVFAAIGAAYGVYGKKCSAGGSTCAVNNPAGDIEDTRSDLARGIDTAGLAVGMGLLVSQAKGEITGQKASFSGISEGSAKNISGVRVTVEHKGTGRKQKVTIPLKGFPGNIFREFVNKQPGMEHKAGVEQGGTFVTVSEEKTDTPDEEKAEPDSNK